MDFKREFSSLKYLLEKFERSKLKIVIETNGLNLDVIIPGFEIFKNLEIEIQEFDFGLKLKKIKI